MKATFGRGQVYSSKKMSKRPNLGSMLFNVFGYTNLGNYARFTIFQKLLSQLDLPKKR